MEVLAPSRTPKNQILLSDMSISSSLSLVVYRDSALWPSLSNSTLLVLKSDHLLKLSARIVIEMNTKMSSCYKGMNKEFVSYLEL